MAIVMIAVVVGAAAAETSSRSSVWIWTNIRTIVFGSLLPGARWMEVNLDFRDKSAAAGRISLSLVFSLVRSGSSSFIL